MAMWFLLWPLGSNRISPGGLWGFLWGALAGLLRRTREVRQIKGGVHQQTSSATVNLGGGIRSGCSGLGGQPVKTPFVRLRAARLRSD